MIYLFNSFGFISFFIVLLLVYWILPSKLRNLLLLAASYFFYASWNWKLLGLILLSTALNYTAGIRIHASSDERKRKAILLFAIATNLALLGFFKYFNFFTENLISLLNLFGLNLNYSTLAIILPLGISFYTFQAMGYVIDVYRKKILPTRNEIDFSLFVAYFPQLIAGPIERAGDLISRIKEKKSFREIKFKEGLYLFLYGLFKKVVIADSIALIVDKIFAIPNPAGAQVAVAVFAFAIQIYADFSGYSNMARGISCFLGIKLSTNFNLPYLAQSASDFWKRWHITLSEWVKDYIYIPLGGNTSFFFGGSALLVAWLAMGIWHGAAWHFVLWGFYWFIVIMAYRLLGRIPLRIKFPEALRKALRIPKKIVLMLLMFSLTLYGWVIFRAQSISQIFSLTKSLAAGIDLSGLLSAAPWHLFAIAIFLIVYEAVQYYKNDQLFICRKSFYYQAIFYVILFLLAINIGATSNAQFIYFQF